MEYGILVAVSEEGDYQIIGAVDSYAEAQEKIAEYVRIGPGIDLMAPANFLIHRRGQGGFYTINEAVYFAETA
jgi:isocitrate dehydrogenase kinase/phosphatase